MSKYILHADGDNFFASCLISKYPRYKNKPLVVGEERGMVTALSPEAKALGIKRGDPLFKIREIYKNNEVIILAGDYKYFDQISSRMHTLIEDTTTAVEKYSIDESFADISEVIRVRKLSPEIIGREVKDRIQMQLAIPVSIGVAPTKTLAKLVSTSSKPNGFKVAMDDVTILPILENTPIEKVWGIGEKSACKLRARGIHTALMLRNIEPHLLSGFSLPIFDIQKELKGIMVHEIMTSRELEHSMISSQSFPSTNDVRFIKSELVRHTHIVSERLRKNKAVAKTFSVYVKNRNQQIIGSERVFMQHEQNTAILLEQLDKMFLEIFKNGDLIRTTGVSVNNIIPLANSNTSLFENNNEKERDIFEVVDRLNKKGHNIHSASYLKK